MAEPLRFRGTELTPCPDGSGLGYFDELTIRIEPPAPGRPLANAWAQNRVRVVAHVQLEDVDLAVALLDMALLLIEEKAAAAAPASEARP